MIIIVKSQQYWVQRYVILQFIMTSTQVSLILSKKWPEIIWNFCVIRLLYQVSVYNLIIHFIGIKCVIWWHWFGSTLPHIMDWCLTAPSHHLNKCWLIIQGVMCHSPEHKFYKKCSRKYSYHMFGNSTFKITTTSPKTDELNQVTCTHFKIGES